MLSKKATEFLKISPLDLIFTFVAFSEYMNFSKVQCLQKYTCGEEWFVRTQNTVKYL